MTLWEKMKEGGDYFAVKDADYYGNIEEKQYITYLMC